MTWTTEVRVMTKERPNQLVNGSQFDDNDYDRTLNEIETHISGYGTGEHKTQTLSTLLRMEMTLKVRYGADDKASSLMARINAFQHASESERKALAAQAKAAQEKRRSDVVPAAQSTAADIKKLVRTFRNSRDIAAKVELMQEIERCINMQQKQNETQAAYEEKHDMVSDLRPRLFIELAQAVQQLEAVADAAQSSIEQPELLLNLLAEHDGVHGYKLHPIAEEAAMEMALILPHYVQSLDTDDVYEFEAGGQTMRIVPEHVELIGMTHNQTVVLDENDWVLLKPAPEADANTLRLLALMMQRFLANYVGSKRPSNFRPLSKADRQLGIALTRAIYGRDSSMFLKAFGQLLMDYTQQLDPTRSRQMQTEGLMMFKTARAEVDRQARLYTQASSSLQQEMNLWRETQTLGKKRNGHKAT